MRTTVVGSDALRRAFVRLSPESNPEITSNALRRIVLETQTIAANKIKRGGTGPPEATRLTSRTGTGRRSIGVNFSDLPASADVGSTLVYMALHEEGGTISVPSKTVRAHERSVVFGRSVRPFNVPSHTVRGHSATYPPRPWLGPAVDEMVPDRAAKIALQEWERAQA